MFTSTSEQTRRFNPEITHFLFPPIQQTSLVLVLGDVFLGLQLFLLCSRQFLLLRFLRFQVSENRSEITFLVFFDFRSIELTKRTPRVGVSDRVRKGEMRWDGVDEPEDVPWELFASLKRSLRRKLDSWHNRFRGSRRRRMRLLLLREVIWLPCLCMLKGRSSRKGAKRGERERGQEEKRTIVLHLDVVSLVFRREEYSVVFKSFPL